MFDKIDNHSELYGLQRGSCCENDYCVSFCEQLRRADGELDDSNVRILKVDDFYNSKWINNPPPAVDCLIIVKERGDGAYSFYLVELKNVSRAQSISPQGSNVEEKFKTTIQRFIEKDFTEVFSIELINLVNFGAWLITDPYKLKHLTDEEYEKKLRETTLNRYATLKPLKLKNKYCVIKPLRPHPTLCYAESQI
jgi:hypothetical protein